MQETCLESSQDKIMWVHKSDLPEALSHPSKVWAFKSRNVMNVNCEVRYSSKIPYS